MNLLDVFFIGVGLSMDAFAVSICKGLKMKVIDLKHSHWIAFVLLLVIGVNMIREALGDSEEEKEVIESVTDFKELFMLAIATSIDALAVGVTFGTMGSKLETSIWASVILIGITTFAISLGGVFIGNAFGAKYKSKAEVVGGIILIIIGLKVVIEHFT